MRNSFMARSLILSTVGFLGLVGPSQGNKHSYNRGVKISWMGHAMFLIENGDGTRIVTDPYSDKIGYIIPQVDADIVTVSHYHHDHDNVQAVGGSPTVIDTLSKEYIHSISIEGIASYHDEVKGDKRGTNIIFKFSLNGITVAHMGDFGQPITSEQVDALKDVDVLLIPVGGTYTIDDKQAAEVVNPIGPKIVIPMHFKTKDYNNIQVAGPEPFLMEMPIVRQKGSSVDITPSSIPKETEVWLMDYIQ